MPTIKLSKRILLELLGRKVSDSELSNKMNFLGTNCESIIDDEVTVEIFPNRPDLLSEHGMARALRTFMGIKPGFTHYTVKKSNVKVIVDKSVRNVRPYTACAVVKGLRFNEDKIKEVIQIQEKLHITYGRNRKKAAIGIYPMEHIKPPINYKALHPQEIRFKPLDLNKELTGSQILAIHPTGREYAHLLEGLNRYAIFVDSKDNILSMPPIINSNVVGKITSSTKDVFIECSGFELEYLKTCLNMIVASLADIGGDVHAVEVRYPDKKVVTPDLSGWDMKLDTAYINKTLGLELKDSEIKFLLAKMGYDYRYGKAKIPSYRADILHPIDLVEDIAIAYDYNNFEGVMPNVSTTAHESSLESFKRKIREMMSNIGLIEVKNYHLTDPNKQTKLMNFHAELVELETNMEYGVLRTWIIPSLLETLNYNRHHDYPQNIYEIGTVFRPNDIHDTRVQEHERLAVAFCGNDANFTKTKQVMDAIAENLGIRYDILETEHPSFIKGRAARISLNEEKIAYLGELHPQVLMNWELEMPVAVLELNITDLFRIMRIGGNTATARVTQETASEHTTKSHEKSRKKPRKEKKVKVKIKKIKTEKMKHTSKKKVSNKTSLQKKLKKKLKKKAKKKSAKYAPKKRVKPSKRHKPKKTAKRKKRR